VAEVDIVVTVVVDSPNDEDDAIISALENVQEIIADIPSVFLHRDKNVCGLRMGDK
jgi:hypothetical protein